MDSHDDPATTTRASRRLGRGVGLAALAALLFGATTPLIKAASGETGPVVVGALLYLGAGLESWLAALASRRERERGWPLLRGAGGRLVLVALVGAAAAPALLVAGLARTDAARASLLLALEAPFTLLLARLFLGERLGRRVLLAAALRRPSSRRPAARPRARSASPSSRRRPSRGPRTICSRARSPIAIP
jgi:drug/metabolite transporter (DMT)-like permease